MVEYQIINSRIAVPYEDFTSDPKIHLISLKDDPFEEKVTASSDDVFDIVSIFHDRHSSVSFFRRNDIPIVVEIELCSLVRKVFDDTTSQKLSETLLSIALPDDRSFAELSSVLGMHSSAEIREKLKDSSHLVYKMVLAARRDDVHPRDESQKDPLQAERILFSHRESMGESVIQLELAIDNLVRAFSVYLRAAAPLNKAAAIVRVNELNKKYIDHTFYVDDDHVCIRAMFLSDNDPGQVLEKLTDTINIGFAEYAEFNEYMG